MVRTGMGPLGCRSVHNPTLEIHPPRITRGLVESCQVSTWKCHYRPRLGRTRPTLMDGDLAVSRPLVRPGLPDIRLLFVRSRLCSALPSDPASRRRPCASLTLHLHPVV